MKSLWLTMSLVPVLLFTGCATSGQTTLLGSIVGSVVGGGIGALADAGPRARGRTQNIFIGATFGSLLGGGGAYLVHDNSSRKEKDAPPMTSKRPEEPPKTDYLAAPGQPILVPPRVESRYVDDQVRGNLFVPGHLEYQIVEPAQWNRDK